MSSGDDWGTPDGDWVTPGKPQEQAKLDDWGATQNTRSKGFGRLRGLGKGTQITLLAVAGGVVMLILAVTIGPKVIARLPFAGGTQTVSSMQMCIDAYAVLASADITSWASPQAVDVLRDRAEILLREKTDNDKINTAAHKLAEDAKAFANGAEDEFATLSNGSWDQQFAALDRLGPLLAPVVDAIAKINKVCDINGSATS